MQHNICCEMGKHGCPPNGSRFSRRERVLAQLPTWASRLRLHTAFRLLACGD